MEIQYRLGIFGEDYFPHVRIKGLLFWGRWKKIAVHPSGYGMYDLPDRNNPKTKKESEEIIEGFDSWYKKQNNCEVSYINYEVNK